MLSDGNRYPRMGELQQQGASGAKNTAASLSTNQKMEFGPNIPVESPGDCSANDRQLVFEVLVGDGRSRSRSHCDIIRARI
jgi:hypothetical protein